jgi:hypothetical protein
MPLLQVKHILQNQPRASVLELAQRCHMAPEQMQDILNHWITKQKIRTVQAVGCGRTCFKCKQAWMQEYEWCETNDCPPQQCDKPCSN